MDYKRIYDEFIEHRKMLPKLEGEYYERHHIVPRCRGGGDDDENLIYLSAREHFVAHCLLAKIFGGACWDALHAMSMDRNGRRVISSGRMFATARSMAAWRRMDQREHEFVEISTGQHFLSTREGLERDFGISRRNASMIIRHKCSIKGICSPEYYCQRRKIFPKSTKVRQKRVLRDAKTCSRDTSKQIIQVFDQFSQQIIAMRRCDFLKEFGVNSSLLSSLLRGRTKSLAKRFTLPELAEPAECNPIHNLSFSNLDTGEKCVMTRTEFSRKVGCSMYYVRRIVDEGMAWHGWVCDKVEKEPRKDFSPEAQGGFSRPHSPSL